MKNSTTPDGIHGENESNSISEKHARIEQAEPEDIEHDRTAKVCQDSSGNPRGVALWINANELEAIGINITETEWIAIRFAKERIQLTSLAKVNC